MYFLYIASAQQLKAHDTYRAKLLKAHSNRDLLFTALPPPSCDQREFGLQTVAQDQGFCGSCYALAFANGAETAYLMSSRPGNLTAKTLRYSVEYLIQKSTRNSGCDGGDAVVLAYEVLRQFGSMKQNKESKYKRAVPGSGDPNTIPYQQIDMIYDYDEHPFDEGTVTRIKQYLASGLPVIGAMYTATNGLLSSLRLDSYLGGIAKQHCTRYLSDHQISFAGYGKFKGKDVWLMKNTWGAGWGDQGYFYIEIGSDAYCAEHFAMSLIPINYNNSGFILDTLGQRDDNPYKNTVRRGRNGLDFDNGTYTHFRLSGTFDATILIFAILLPGLLAGTFWGWCSGRKATERQFGNLVR